MSVCVCGAEIRWVSTRQGERLPIEPHASASQGPDRYHVSSYGDGWTVVEIKPSSPMFGHLDHRVVCPRR